MPAQGSYNNGNVMGYYYLDNANPTYSHAATYQYNTMNQLTGASASPVGSGNISYSQSFNYTGDGTNGEFGNMSCTTGSSGYCPQVTFDPSSNRMYSIGSGNPVYPTYDAAGNLTSDGAHSYQWDAEERLKSIDNGAYLAITYDAFGQQAEWGNLNLQFVRNQSGVAIGTYNASGWADPRVPEGIERSVSYAGGATTFYHTNNLGSWTMATTQAGSVSNDFLAYPWGQDWQGGNSVWADIPESNYGLGKIAFHRYFNINWGRWLSPDPAGLGAVDLTNPQSLNRYAYALNNPTTFTDPLGLQSGCTSAQHCPPIQDPATCDNIACSTPGGLPVGFSGSNGLDYLTTGEGFYGGGDGDAGIWWGPIFNSSLVWLPLSASPTSWFTDFSGGTAASNGRNCAVGPATKLQYAEAAAQVSALTSEFFSGLGPGNLTFDPNSATSQVMAQSGPVQDVLISYYMTGQTSGLYTFGLSGLVSAGGNPVAQFVGSFRWSITPTNGGINLSLTNTTSFRSLIYDVGPQWQRGNHWYPTPMGNTHQTYNITATCHQ